jgi:hypothetical protein
VIDCRESQGVRIEFCSLSWNKIKLDLIKITISFNSSKILMTSMQLPSELSQVFVDPLRGTKKRRVMTSELIGKFRSKSDFMKYLTENRKLSLKANDISLGSSILRAAKKNGEQGFPQASLPRRKETAPTH